MNKKLNIIATLIPILLFVILLEVLIFVRVHNINKKVEEMDEFFRKNDLYKIDGIIMYDGLEDFKIESKGE